MDEFSWCLCNSAALAYGQEHGTIMPGRLYFVELQSGLYNLVRGTTTTDYASLLQDCVASNPVVSANGQDLSYVDGQGKPRIIPISLLTIGDSSTVEDAATALAGTYSGALLNGDTLVKALLKLQSLGNSVNDQVKDYVLDKLDDFLVTADHEFVELVTFIKGLKTDEITSLSDFVAGPLGSGFKIWMENGKSKMQVDQLQVLDSAIFNEAVINQIKFQGGVMIYSAACMEVSAVSNTVGYHTLSFDTRKDSVQNQFRTGDIVKCQRRLGGVTIKYYMSVVAEVGSDYIKIFDASAGATWHDGTGLPEVGDTVVHFGSKTDLARQSAIEVNVLAGGRQTFYQYLNNFTTVGKNYIDLGMVEQDGQMVNMIRSYGQAYIGARDLSSYIRFNEETQRTEFVGEVSFLSADGRRTEVSAAIQAARDAAIAAAELDAMTRVNNINVGAANIFTSSTLEQGDLNDLMAVTCDSTIILCSEDYYTCDNE